MVNPHAGEVAISVEGKDYVAKLTLGSLVELEGALGADSLVALAERFEGGKFTSRDVLSVLVAGLRGGGWHGSSEDLLHAQIGGGPISAARSAAELLARAFQFG